MAHIKIAPGSSSTALSFIGAGAVVIFPNEPWIGYVLITLGVLVFVFGIRIDGWHVAFLPLWRKLKPLNFVPIHEAVSHVAKIVGDKNIDEHDPCFPETRKAIRQAGLNGDVRMRGRRQLQSRDEYTSHFDEVHQDIPAEYWKTSQLGPMASAAVDIGASHTMPVSPWDWHPTDFTKANKQYASILAHWGDLIKLWPDKSSKP
jgi:hypothetical protein